MVIGFYHERILTHHNENPVGMYNICMIDTAAIRAKAGNGGDGLVSFRREKYIPKGGPWGGDGGRGGNLIIEVDPNLNTLSPFRRQRVYNAQNGQNGQRNRMKGKDGEDLIIKVPLGTLIYNDNNELIHDITDPEQRITLSKGGLGGLGNWHFKSSVNRTPREATAGGQTEEIHLNLELKLIADVGIIGLPSSGKSTLLNALARTNVKTADYHFTTLEPNIGVLHTHKDIVIADIPGLIEGAAEGKGLGHDFLKHIERTKMLVHLLDGSSAIIESPEKLLENYEITQRELEKWDSDTSHTKITNLIEKHQIVAINKSDLFEHDDKVKTQISKSFKKKEIDITYISASTGQRLEELVQLIVDSLDKIKPITAEVADDGKSSKVIKMQDLPNKRIVFRKKVD